MTDIAIQYTHDNTSGNVHVITVQSIITFIYATCTCTFTLKHFIKYTHMYTVCYILYVIEAIIQQQSDDNEVLKELYKYQHSSGKWCSSTNSVFILNIKTVALCEFNTGACKHTL